MQWIITLCTVGLHVTPVSGKFRYWPSRWYSHGKEKNVVPETENEDTFMKRNASV